MTLNIKARINARKVLFSYFYEKFFLENIILKPFVLTDIAKITKSFELEGEIPVIIEELKEKINNFYQLENWEEDIEYIIDNFFNFEKEFGIDMEYINIMVNQYQQYRPNIQSIIDKYVTTFTFTEMDMVDQILFLIGYMEYQIFKLPKNIILNEMIELGKRYGDEDAYKLLNAIGNKLFDDTTI